MTKTKNLNQPNYDREPKEVGPEGYTRGGPTQKELRGMGRPFSSIHNLAKLVEEMRAAQKDYFSTVSGTHAKQQHLQNAKKLEKMVDQAVIKVLYPITGDLFPGQGGGHKQIDP